MATKRLVPNVPQVSRSSSPTAAALGSVKAAGDPIIRLYRVVDSTELAYLQAHGNYGSNPSHSGKYFALTLTGAQTFASAPMNAGSRITGTELSQSIVNIGFMVNNPGQYGAGRSVFFEERLLPTIYGTMARPVILPKPGP